MLKVKRVYDPPSADDGFRILVDRLWPRGLTKERAKVDLWLKEIAPSDALRKWFAHNEARWAEFKQKYFAELTDKPKLIDIILEKTRGGEVTLLFSARNENYNNAVALKEYVATKRR